MCSENVFLEVKEKCLFFLLILLGFLGKDGQSMHASCVRSLFGSGIEATVSKSDSYLGKNRIQVTANKFAFGKRVLKRSELGKKAKHGSHFHYSALLLHLLLFSGASKKKTSLRVGVPPVFAKVLRLAYRIFKDVDTGNTPASSPGGDGPPQSIWMRPRFLVSFLFFASVENQRKIV